MAEKTLVTFARNRIGYVICKNLAKNGIEVTAADSIKFAMSFFSRFVKDKAIYHNQHDNEKKFIDSIIKICLEKGITTIISGHEESYTLSKYQDKLEKAGIKTALPAYTQIKIAHDKNKITAEAEKLKIKTPKTYRFDSIADFKKNFNKIKRYPVVIKLTKTRGGVGFSKAISPEELFNQYQKTVKEFGIKKPKDFPIVQEYIDGYGLGVSMLFNKGKAVASFTHKRIWEYPPEGGFSVERISTHHKKAEAQAKTLLEKLNWHGVAMVEFRVDHKTNEPYFLEINPRFWGSLNQAVVAGVEFPYLLWQVANKKHFKPVFKYRLGVRTRWVAGMIVGLPAYLKSPARWRYLSSFFSVFSRNLYFDDFSFSDPLPFLMEFIKPLLDVFSGKSLREQDFEEVKRSY